MLYNNEEWEAATTIFEEALDRNKQIGDSQAMISTLINLGLIEVERDNFIESNRYLNQALTLGQQAGDRFTIIQVMLNLAWAHISQERTDEATHYLETCRTQYNLNEYPSLEASYYYYSGLVEHLAGRYILALADLTKAFEIARDTKYDMLIRSINKAFQNTISQLTETERHDVMHQKRSGWERIEQYLKRV